MRRRIFLPCLVLALAMTASATAALAKQQGRGFRTSQPAMLAAEMQGVKITPLLTVGDVLPSGFTFEAIPDGISVRRDGGRVELFVNHETSKVPFPYTTANPTAANGENDFDNAQVSRLVLNPGGKVLEGSFVIPSSAGFQRFCSNYLATSAEGFDRDILLTNEESPDYVFRQEDSWPPPLGDPAEKEAGLVVALDVDTGTYRPIHGMGRHNHENSVPIPGYEDLVVLSGDDTFTSGPLTIPPGGPMPAGQVPAQSQLYSYIADDTDALLDDEGTLYAFRSTTAGFTDYYDFTPGSAADITGEFIEVPKNIATGLDDDGSELTSTDVGFPAPPTDGSWQRDLRDPGDPSATPPVPQRGIDGPQWVLEYWSDLNNVFQFVRVEDVAYDKRPGMENVVYIVDSGRGTAGVPQAGRSTNGRIWKMELDPDDPTQVDSLTVFVEGDDSAVKTPTEIHQPDNLESTPKGILVTEDPGSSQQFFPDEANATTGRLWWVPFSGTAQVVARVDQSADGGSTDVDGRDNAKLGAWESSGIVDASSAFGRGAFLIDVQAHTLWVESAPGDDNFAPAGPDFTYKREGGQLLLIRIPFAA